MPNNNAGKSKNIPGVLFAVLFAVLGLTSCGGGGGGGGGASSAAPPPAVLTVSLVPSRTSGVAPLAVFFDASATSAVATSRPFHDIEYRWDFGDVAGSPVSGPTWSRGSRAGVSSRNAATGPVSAHVFENAGTFNVTLTVFDGTNTATRIVTVTVTNPETVFATTTACVANGVMPVAGVDGCPATATLLSNSSSFDAAMTTAIAAGARRVLFRRGDTFTSAVPHTISAAGPGMIGAYGSGASPNPNITMGVIGQFASILRFSNSDWRVMDLAFDGLGTADQFGIVNIGPRSQITVLRVTTINLSAAVNWTGADQAAVVDSNFSLGDAGSTVSNYGVYCETCTNVMLMGNDMFLNTIQSHNIRLQGVIGFVVSNSTQTGSNLIEPITVRGNTQYGMLSDNRFVDGNVTVNPQNATSNEFQRDIIFERNWFVAGSNTGNPLSLEGSGITVRSNIFDLSLATGYRAIEVVHRTGSIAPIPDLVNIYNNTIFNSFANDGNLLSFVAVRYSGGLDSSCRSEVKNNLAYSPNTLNLAPVLIQVAGGSCVITGASGTFGNSSDSQIRNTDPLFANATPTNPVDFIIGAGSYALNTGVAVPVFSDFFRTVRPQGSAIDVGAVERP